MKVSPRVAAIVLAAALCHSGLRLGRAATEAPATAPAGPVSASPDAQVLLQQVRAAVVGLQSLEVHGTIQGDFDVAGHKEHHAQSFAASFQGPNQFRHETPDDVLVGSTGQKVYVYLPGQNSYLMVDAPAAPLAPAQFPQPMGEVLALQDPNLLLALSGGAVEQLWPDMAGVVKLPDTTWDGAACPTLQFTDAKARPVVVVLVDPATHLIRQARFNFQARAEDRGATDVKTAAVTVAYQGLAVNPLLSGDRFAWAPPAGAKDAAAERQASQEQSPALALVGHAAPDFTLSDLDGRGVSLAQFKGNVVVLEFGTTWCGPCRVLLPHLDGIYRQNAGQGLKAFAIDIREDKQMVQAVVNENKLAIPVLLDLDGQVAEKYLADTYPQTVIIGKDGYVRQVFVGLGPNTADQIRGEIAAAMK